MKKLSKLLTVCAVLVLLIACAAFSVSASQTESTVTVPTWDDFAQTGFDSADTPCPHCVAAGAADTTPEWTKYTGTGETFTSTTKHIYIDNDEKLLFYLILASSDTDATAYSITVIFCFVITSFAFLAMSAQVRFLLPGRCGGGLSKASS